MKSFSGYDASLDPPEEREDCPTCGGDPNYCETTVHKGGEYDLPCRTCEGRGWVATSKPEEETEVEETEVEEPITRNSDRAAAIGRSPAMATKFGRDVDPDRVKRSRDLDSAMDKYETFHAKRPLRAVELKHDLPTSWICVGQAVSTMYRTDKWHEDGDDEDYKHVHDFGDGKEYSFGKGVKVYEPAREARRSLVESKDGKKVRANVAGKPEKLPTTEPGALTLLGYCLGIFVRRFDDEEVYELNPRGCYLFCSPSGDMLALYSPKKQPDGSSGFLAVLIGGKLRVLEDGIDG